MCEKVKTKMEIIKINMCKALDRCGNFVLIHPSRPVSPTLLKPFSFNKKWDVKNNVEEVKQFLELFNELNKILKGIYSGIQ